MSRRVWAYAAALALTGGGLPFACWSTRLHERAEVAPELRIEPARPEPAVARAPETKELAPGVVKTRLLESSDWVRGAVPFRAPSAEHKGGTLVLATSEGLLEIDIDKGTVVRRAASLYANSACRLASSGASLVVSWREGLEAKLAFYDERLELVKLQVVGDEQVSEVSASGDDAVVVYDAFPPGSGFELVRFDLRTGQRVTKRRHPGSITTWDEYPAGLVVKNDRIHVLVTRPNIEVRTYRLDLGLAGVVRLPLPPRHDADIPPFGTLDAAADELLVTASGKTFLVDPTRRALRSLPPPPSEMTNENFIDVDPSGRVLVDSGHLAERVGGPFERVVTLRAEKWKLDGWDVPTYVDTPRAGFFWGGKALIVTVNPEVSLIRIDPERTLAAR